MGNPIPGQKSASDLLKIVQVETFLSSYQNRYQQGTCFKLKTDAAL